MLTLLHASDFHFGPPYLPAVGEALVRAAVELKPDVIVASGDFTQRAKAEQFAAARAWLDQLPKVSIVVVPGNHDIPLYRVYERLFAPYALYERYIARELNSVLVRDDAVIVALNTTSPLRAITRGRIAPWQLDYCEQAFRGAAPGVARIVVAHQHFAAAPDYEDQRDAMHRGHEALDRFNSLGVDLILGGHLHRAYIGNSLDVFPTRIRNRGIIIVQSGTATSRRGRARERAKNSFNVIQLTAATIRVTHHMYFHEQGGFAPLSRHEFPRQPHMFLDGAPLPIVDRTTTTGEPRA